MLLRKQMAKFQEQWEAIHAVANSRESLGFADLMFPPFDIEAFLKRLFAKENPGILIETTARVVVVEEHHDGLRFYAGPWGNEMDNHPSELGIFRSTKDAVYFATEFLVQQQHPDGIKIPRSVVSADPNWNSDNIAES